MTAETIESTATVPDGRYLTDEQRAELLWYLSAPKRLPYRVIAHKFRRAEQTIKNFASENSAEIVEMNARRNQTLDEDYWARDEDHRLALRQDAINNCLWQQSAIEDRIRYLERHANRDDLSIVDEIKGLYDQWNKKEQLKQQMLRYVEDAAGALPTRAPAVTSNGSTASIELIGVDTAELLKHWEQAG